MKETSFIKQNKKKWKRFEQLYNLKKKDPDKVNKLFVEITDDFSYSRTFYPKRSVRVYLNYLAQRVFLDINKKAKNNLSSFAKFWKEDLPLEMYKSRKSLLASFIVFGIATLIGIISTYFDPEFPRIILGDQYVEMTNKYIADEDPMKVYKTENEFEMFLMIFWNNIRVDLLCFIFGIFGTIGTGIILVNNGVMLGAFQTFFYNNKLLLVSALTIWIHGTIEICAAIISGAAGFVVGNSIMFPKSLPRIASAQIGVKRGLRIFVGIAPFTLVAAFFEGFLTRHTEMPGFIKAGIIVLSFVLMVGYFVIYPYLLARRRNFKLDVEKQPHAFNIGKIELYKLRDNFEIFHFTLSLYKVLISRLKRHFMGLSFILVAGLVSIFIFTSHAIAPEWPAEYSVGWVADVFRSIGHGFANFFHVLGFQENTNVYLVLLYTLITSLNLFFVFHELKKYFFPDKYTLSYSKAFLSQYWKYLFLTLPFFFIGNYAPVAITVILGIISAFYFIPLTAMYSAYENEKKQVNSAFKTIWKGFIKNIGLSILLISSVAFIFAIIIFSHLTFPIFEEFIEWHIMVDNENYLSYVQFLYYVVLALLMQLFIPMFAIAFTFSFYSTVEEIESKSLFKKIKNFGAKSKIYESIDEGEY